MHYSAVRLMLCLAASAIPAAVVQTPAPPATQPAVRSVAVTPAMVSAQRFRIDLSRSGTVYTIPSTVDPTRVQVSGGKRTYTLAELVTIFGRSMRGSVRLARPADMPAKRLAISGSGIRPRQSQFSCTDVSCACTDDVDCDNMFRDARCGTIAGCDTAGCWCLKV